MSCGATKGLPETAGWKRSVKAPEALLRLGYRDPGAPPASLRAGPGRLLRAAPGRIRLVAARRRPACRAVDDVDERHRRDERGGVGRRGQRPRLGARPRAQPVGRLRLREARLDLRSDPRPLLPRHQPRRGQGRHRPRPARLGEEGRAGVAGAVDADGCDRHEGRARCGAARSEGEARRRRPPGAGAAVHARRLRAARRERHALRRPADRLEQPESRPGRRPAGPRDVLRRSRPGRDAVVVAGRGAQGPGGRRAFVRTREPDEGPRLRPVRRHERSGLRRRQGGQSCDGRGRRGDEGPGRPLRRQGRGHLVLLDVGRPDGVRRRRDRGRRPVSRPGRGPLRHCFPVPQLGPRAVRRRDGREPLQARVADRGHPARHRPLGSRHLGDVPFRRRVAGHRHRQPGAEDARAALHLVHLGRAAPARVGKDDDLRRRSLAGRQGPRRGRRLARGEAVRPRLGACWRARPRRRRLVRNRRPSTDRHPVPARVGERPRGPRVDRRRRPRRRRDDEGRGDGHDEAGRSGCARPAAVEPERRGRMADRGELDHGRLGRLRNRGPDCRGGRLPCARRSRPRPRAGPLEDVHLLLKALLAAIIAAAALAAPVFAFDNTEPLAEKQWYLTRDNAWSFWPTQPKLAPISVAVIDSGIDGTHPDLMGRVVAAKSFVGGSPFRDDNGHGTFVAGLIAANPTNNEGIAGLGFNVRLMVAKVVGANGTISLPGEVAAIHWAVDNGARVINLSLGGVRDPLNPRLDVYAPLEQDAVDYAYSRGVVVVAAVGNGPQSPATPWSFADYPAALPHVIGVSAVRQDGSVPDYSNRDAVFNDIAAPGAAIFSTIPQNLTADRADCANRPYSDCRTEELRQGIGTSFSAPQVSAAAALRLGQDPALKPGQVSWLLERSADDSSPTTGCPQCPVGRDLYAGWGTLDVLKALTMLSNTPLPPPD